jgi:hypothetical protein
MEGGIRYLGAWCPWLLFLQPAAGEAPGGYSNTPQPATTGRSSRVSAAAEIDHRRRPLCGDTARGGSDVEVGPCRQRPTRM